jgi:hypothetical protein
VVVASGYGWNLFRTHSDFSNSGAFGDSFGPLGAVMAGFAALAAFETLREQRSELARQKLREEAEDDRRKKEEKKRAATELRQAQLQQRTVFESTFFNLLDAFRDIAKETDVGTGETRKVSRDAFQRILRNLQEGYRATGSPLQAWINISGTYKNDLNHYFRFLYHLIKFVDGQEGVDKYFYIRFVRAALSEAEIVLLFVNCAFGEGRDKFLPLVEKYALLHNVSQESRDKWGMDGHVLSGAFEYNEKRGHSKSK